MTAAGPRMGSSFRSVAELWHHRIESTPDAEALTYRHGGHWVTESWIQVGVRVRNIANALLKLELAPEDRVCLWSETRYEWVVADLAILCAGGATTTIYPTSPEHEAYFIADHSEAVVIFCDTRERAEQLSGWRARLPRVRQVIVFDEDSSGPPISPDGWVVTLSVFETLGRAYGLDMPGTYDAARRAIAPDSLATLIYTSGTTGTPKGVMLTHDSWVYEAEAVDSLGLISPADKQYLYLPLSHVFAKVLQILFIRLGVPTVIDGDTDRLVANLKNARPTFMGAVPRMFEKAFSRTLTRATEGGRARYALFRWALRTGSEISKRQQSRRPLSPVMMLKSKAANQLVFSKVREAFGGHIRFLISGGAPLSPEIAEFFHACGVLILEGYGLTESAAASCVNTPDDYIFGSVGRPLPGTQVQIAEDGEILLRGRGVMRGYFKQPDETAQAFTTDGWLKTGDIGTLLESGHLMITDRKKELIITAGGKNIAPAHFQKLLKTSCPYVSEVVMHGDRRPFCTALITIHEDHVRQWAQGQGIGAYGYGEMAARPEVRSLIHGFIQRVNRDLAPYEQVKAFALLPEDFSQVNGTLTPSLKVRRKVVEARWKAVLDGFYPEVRLSP